MDINFVDMLNWEKSAMREGRIVFNRYKTARLYFTKVGPEAMVLIGKYAGESHLQLIMDSRKDYLQYVRQANNALRKIGDCERGGLGDKLAIGIVGIGVNQLCISHTRGTLFTRACG